MKSVSDSAIVDFVNLFVRFALIFVPFFKGGGGGGDAGVFFSLVLKVFV